MVSALESGHAVCIPITCCFVFLTALAIWSGLWVMAKQIPCYSFFSLLSFPMSPRFTHHTSLTSYDQGGWEHTHIHTHGSGNPKKDLSPQNALMP